MFKIGNIVINGNIVVAPMAGITNTSYRTILKEMGADLIYAEMVSDKALVYQNEKTYKLLDMREEERPIVQQIFGSDKESFVEAAKIVEKMMKPDIIDINMGCPVPKVALRAQAGSALLKDPDKIYEIVKAVSDAVKTPVTVKIRSGWDEDHINAVEVAKICEKAGAKAIAIHARTRKQGYSGKADWDIIKKVKEAVSVPVIGNGDVKDIDSFTKMLEYTSCDAVMIGRALLGNPWLIKEIKYYQQHNKELEKPSLEDKIQMIKKHYKMLSQDKSEKLALLEMRTHIMYYLKSEKNTAKLKEKICKTNNIEEIFQMLDEFYNCSKTTIM